MKELEPGVRVYYVLPRNRDRPRTVYLAATVVRRSSRRRVTIDIGRFHRLRSVSPLSVCLELPPGERSGFYYY